jgi:hypothetical protein
MLAFLPACPFLHIVQNLQAHFDGLVDFELEFLDGTGFVHKLLDLSLCVYFGLDAMHQRPEVETIAHIDDIPTVQEAPTNSNLRWLLLLALFRFYF